MIKVKNLFKRFGNVVALSNINIEIQKGEIFGIVGPNGSGKTTFLRSLIGEILPNKGEIFINDKPIKEKDKIDFSYMSEKRNGIDRFKLSDYRKFYSMIYPNWDDSLFFALVSSFKIPNERKFKNMSIGNKSALMFALTVASNTDYIILDEPTQHLDPERRYVALDVIRKLSSNGKTIIISSHQMEELENLLTSFAIILNSLLLYADTLDNAKDYHRVVSNIKNLDGLTKIAILNEQEILIKTLNSDFEFGRYPRFGEIVVGYLKRGIAI